MRVLGTGTSSARPFRWDLVPRLSRGQAWVARQAARHVWDGGPGGEGWAAVDAALGGMLGGTRLRLDPGPVVAFARDDLAAYLAGAPFAAVRIIRADGRGFAVVVDGAITARLAACAFGVASGPDAELPAARPATLAERGVLGAVVAAVLDAHRARDLVVADVVDTSAALAPLFSDPWIVAQAVVAEVAGARGLLRVLAPESFVVAPAPVRSPAARWSEAAQRRLELVSVDVAVVGGVARLSLAELARLAPRDVVLLDEPGIDAAGRGRVRLSVGRGAFAADSDGAAATVRGGYESGERMKAPDEALLQDVPLELECRIGSFTLTARELLELAPGAVVPLGRPAGGEVELTCRGKVVARGELVDVEGELGVRVLDLVR